MKAALLKRLGFFQISAASSAHMETDPYGRSAGKSWTSHLNGDSEKQNSSWWTTMVSEQLSRTLRSTRKSHHRVVFFIELCWKSILKRVPVNSVWCGKQFYCAVSLAVFKVVGENAGTIITKNNAALLIDRISFFTAAVPHLQFKWFSCISFFPWSYSRWINHPSTRFLKTVGLLLVLYQEKHLVATAMLCRWTIATECI